MHDELIWHIGKEAAPLDEPPNRAYFYWKRAGQIVRSEDYSADELQSEIQRLEQNGEDAGPFVEALHRLQLLG